MAPLSVFWTNLYKHYLHLYFFITMLGEWETARGSLKDLFTCTLNFFHHCDWFYLLCVGFMHGLWTFNVTPHPHHMLLPKLLILSWVFRFWVLRWFLSFFRQLCYSGQSFCFKNWGSIPWQVTSIWNVNW